MLVVIINNRGFHVNVRKRFTNHFKKTQLKVHLSTTEGFVDTVAVNGSFSELGLKMC